MGIFGKRLMLDETFQVEMDLEFEIVEFFCCWF